MEHTIANFLTSVSTNNLIAIGFILFFLAPYIIVVFGGTGFGWIVWQNTKALTNAAKHMEDCNKTNASLVTGVSKLNEHLTGWEGYKRVQDDTLDNVKDTKQLVVQLLTGKG